MMHILIEEDGYALVSRDGKFNFVNTEGFLLFDDPYQEGEDWFDSADPFQDGYAIVRRNRLWNAVLITGNFISPEWFDGVERDPHGYLLVRRGGEFNWYSSDEYADELSETWFTDYDDAEDFINNYRD